MPGRALLGCHLSFMVQDGSLLLAMMTLNKQMYFLSCPDLMCHLTRELSSRFHGSGLVVGVPPNVQV